MKEKVRIGGALALGTLIILMAFLARGNGEQQQALVIAAPPRDLIETNDLNGDGTPDWEEHLAENIFKTIELPPSLGAGSNAENYAAPTTLTGKFSEAFLQDYLQGKVDGKDFSDPAAFIESAIDAIEKNTRSKRHTAGELFLIPTTQDTAHTYGNTLQEIIKRHSVPTENEMVLLKRALEAKDPEMLKPLTPIADGYTNIIADTLMVPVPDKLILEHLAILNAYEEVLADIEAGTLAFSDPLYTLARVRDYETHARGLLDAYIALAKALVREGVVYTSNEPGAFYRLLETL